MAHITTNIPRLLIAAILILSATLAAACNPAAPSGQVNQGQAVTKSFTNAVIVAKGEWKPSEENTLICAAEDTDGGELTYVWTAEKGTIKGDGKTVSWTAPDTAGEYSVSVKVTSAKSGEVTVSRKFKVSEDPYHNKTADKTIYMKLSIPASESVKLTSRVRTYNTAEIQCMVEGAEAGELTYTWIAPAGKMLGNDIASGKESKIGWIAPGQGGNFTVSVVVTDKAGRKAEGSVDFEVLCCRDP